MKKQIVLGIMLLGLIFHSGAIFTPLAAGAGFILNISTKKTKMKRNLIGLAGVNILYAMPVLGVSSVLFCINGPAAVCVGATGVAVTSVWATSEYMVGLLLARGAYNAAYAICSLVRTNKEKSKPKNSDNIVIVYVKE